MQCRIQGKYSVLVLQYLFSPYISEKYRLNIIMNFTASKESILYSVYIIQALIVSRESISLDSTISTHSRYYSIYKVQILQHLQSLYSTVVTQSILYSAYTAFANSIYTVQVPESLHCTISTPSILITVQPIQYPHSLYSLRSLTLNKVSLLFFSSCYLYISSVIISLDLIVALEYR